MELNEIGKNTVQIFDCDPDKDDLAVFYSNYFGGAKVIIIPKETNNESLSLAETPTTYVITVKPRN